MNAQIKSTDTEPQAVTPHDAMVLAIAARIQKIGQDVAQSIELHPADQASLIDELLGQLSLEHMRLRSAGEQAYEFAGECAAEEAEVRWNAEHSEVSP